MPRRSGRHSLCLRLALVAVLVLSACGGSDDGGTSGDGLTRPTAAPSKEAFIRQANAICDGFNAEVAKLGDQLADDASVDELVAVYQHQALPAFRRAVDQMVALGFPTPDGAALQTLFDDLYAGLGRIETDTKAVLESDDDPFESVNQRLTAYGLASCSP